MTVSDSGHVPVFQVSTLLLNSYDPLCCYDPLWKMKIMLLSTTEGSGNERNCKISRITVIHELSLNFAIHTLDITGQQKKTVCKSLSMNILHFRNVIYVITLHIPTKNPGILDIMPMTRSGQTELQCLNKKMVPIDQTKHATVLINNIL